MISFLDSWTNLTQYVSVSCNVLRQNLWFRRQERAKVLETFKNAGPLEPLRKTMKDPAQIQSRGDVKQAVCSRKVL